MTGTSRYLRALESLHELFDCYPVHAEISAVHIAPDLSGQIAVVVRLSDTDAGILAAGIVEWNRTLDEPAVRAWRVPGGGDVYISVAGYPPECEETSIEVLTGPIPHSGRLDVDIEPGRSARLDDETLYGWFGSEVAHTWPFKTPTTGVKS